MFSLVFVLGWKLNLGSFTASDSCNTFLLNAGKYNNRQWNRGRRAAQWKYGWQQAFDKHGDEWRFTDYLT